jgi:hypothetical protein
MERNTLLKDDEKVSSKVEQIKGSHPLGSGGKELLKFCNFRNSFSIRKYKGNH